MIAQTPEWLLLHIEHEGGLLTLCAILPWEWEGQTLRFCDFDYSTHLGSLVHMH